MSPILEVIDAGHYQRSEPVVGAQVKLVCREDREDWPCPMILAARRQHAKENRCGT